MQKQVQSKYNKKNHSPELDSEKPVMAVNFSSAAGQWMAPTSDMDVLV